MIQATRRAFLKGTISYMLAQVLLRLRGLILLPIYADRIGIERYAIINQITVTVALLVPIMTLRLEQAAVRFLSSEDDRRRLHQKFFAILIVIMLLSALAMLLLSVFATAGSRAVFGDPAYADFMQLAGLLLFTSVLSTYLRNYFRIVRRIPTLSLILFSQSLLETIMMLIAVYLGYGVEGALWSLIGVKAFSILILLFLVARESDGIGFSFQDFPAMLRYSIPLVPNPAMAWTVHYADRIIIIQILGLAALGAYSASYSLGKMVNLLITPIGFVLFPFLTNLWDHGELAEVRRYFTYGTRYYLMLALPSCVGIALISQPLINILATAEFATDSILVFWITLGFVFNGLYQINSYAFHLVRKTQYNTMILAVSAVLNVLLNLLLVPRIGLHGAAIATAASFFLMAATALFIGKRLLQYGVEWVAVFKMILACLVMAVCICWIPINDFWGILTALIAGTLIYIVSLMLLRTFSDSELLRVRHLLHSLAPN